MKTFQKFYHLSQAPLFSIFFKWTTVNTLPAVFTMGALNTLVAMVDWTAMNLWDDMNTVAFILGAKSSLIFARLGGWIKSVWMRFYTYTEGEVGFVQTVSTSSESKSLFFLDSLLFSLLYMSHLGKYSYLWNHRIHVKSFGPVGTVRRIYLGVAQANTELHFQKSTLEKKEKNQVTCTSLNHIKW